jgi:hypothetical protein
MIDEKFIIVSTILYLYGSSTYLIDTIKGKVKPNKVSWSMWAIAPLIAFAAQVKQGVGIQSLMTFLAGFIPLLVFIASFLNKKSYWKIEKFDLACGLFSIVGLILWYITKIGNIAILFSIISDATASIPTITKSWKYPETENYKLFLFASINAAVNLLTLKTWDFAHYSFSLYIFILCAIVAVLIKFKLGKKFQLSKSSRS